MVLLLIFKSSFKVFFGVFLFVKMDKRFVM